MLDRSGKAVLVGHLPGHYVAGASLGFKLLVEGLQERGKVISVVDFAESGPAHNPGTFQLGRLIRQAVIFLRFIPKLVRARAVYMTIGASRIGVMRDAMFVMTAVLLRKRIVLHLKGAGIDDVYSQSGTGLRWLMRSMYGRASSLVVLGQSLRQQFEFVPGYEERVVVIENSVGGDIGSDSGKLKEVVESQGFTILYLSNLITSKGYWTVLEACELLSERGVEFHCDFCGSFREIGVGTPTEGAEALKRRFLERIDAQVLRGRVQYHGIVRGEDKVAMLQNADVFVLPTHYPWEGQPISIIEAMAFGVPVITTEYRGIPDLIADGVNGLFTEFGDASMLADRIQFLAENPDVSARMSSAGLEIFNTKFSREAHLDRMEAVIFGVT